MQVQNTPVTAAAAASKRKTKPAKAQPKPAEAPKAEKPKAEKDWTVLLYMAGHNDLEQQTTQSFLELEQVGSDKNVNVVAQLGRLSQDKLKELQEERGQEYKPTNIDGDWSGVRRYYVTKNEEAGNAMEKALLQMFSGGEVKEEPAKIGSKMIADLGEADMSKATTLADFLLWGMKQYPAKHYLVALLDHGGGWRGAFTDDAAGGGSGKIMEAEQIAAALNIVEKGTGKKIDNVDMVACLMASSEMAYEMRDSAKYLSASEEMGTTEAFHYAPIIDALQTAAADGKPLQPKQLGQLLVNHYQDKPEAFVTKSTIELSKMGDVKEAIDGLAAALTKTKTSAEDLKAAIDGSQRMARVAPYQFYDQFRDLYGMAEQLDKSEDIKDKAVKSAAKKVMEAVDKAVVANLAHEYSREEVVNQGYSMDGRELETMVKHTQGKFDTHGLTIYAPLEKPYLSESLMGTYNGLALSKETGWDEFITKLNGADEPKGKKGAPSHSPAPVPTLDNEEKPAA